jgi:hypothetical protein
LRVCWCRALSLMRGRVCHLQFLLALASAVILGSEYHETHDQILLSHIRDFPFSRLLRLAGLRWRYSTPPPHGILNFWLCPLLITFQHGPCRNTPFTLLLSNNTSSAAYVFVAAGTCLPSRCLESDPVYLPRGRCIATGLYGTIYVNTYIYVRRSYSGRVIVQVVRCWLIIAECDILWDSRRPNW